MHVADMSIPYMLLRVHCKRESKSLIFLLFYIGEKPCTVLGTTIVEAKITHCIRRLQYMYMLILLSLV